MFRRFSIGPALAFGACLLATGCGDGAAPDGGVGAGQLLDRAARMVQPLPGLYRTVSILASYDLPNADPRDAARLREMAGLLQPNETTACLTPDDAARGWMPLVEQLQEGDCTMQRFDADAATLEAAIRCQLPGGVTSDIALTGMATPTASQMQVVIDQQGASIPGGMQRLTLEIESERLGDCD